MDRGVCRGGWGVGEATAHGVTKSQTQFHFLSPLCDFTYGGCDMTKSLFALMNYVEFSEQTPRRQNSAG